ncbi:MAG: hypothetical protein ABFS86_06640 [Planctomycetota bacterium]
MKRPARTLAVLLLAAAGAACTSPRASTGEEVLAGTADTAYVVRDGATFVFWEVPKFIVWTVPKALIYDYPRDAILAVRGNRAQVEAAMSELAANDLPPEAEGEISENLHTMTGLPIRSNERWLEWWKDARERPQSQWRADFIKGAIHDLESRNYFVRAMAAEDLHTMYGRTLDYDPKAPPDERAAGADRWREHLRETGLPPHP